MIAMELDLRGCGIADGTGFPRRHVGVKPDMEDARNVQTARI